MTDKPPRFGSGRKPKSPEEKFNNYPQRFTFQLTDAQAQKIVDMAQARDVSVSALIREMIDREET